MEIKKPAFTLSWDTSAMTAEQCYVAEEYMKKMAESMQVEIDKATLDFLTYGTAVISPEGKAVSPAEYFEDDSGLVSGVMNLDTKA